MKQRVITLSLCFLFLLTASSVFAAPITSTTAQANPSTGTSTSAQAAPGREVFPIEPPIQDNSMNFLGQDQYYSVTFRGNGEAVITMKTIFSNLQKEPINNINLRISVINPQDVVAYQVKREPQCIRYQPGPYGNGLQTNDINMMQKCEEYGQPDYYNYYGKTSYLKAETIVKGDTVEIGLPNPVAENASASVVVYYRGTGYAKKSVFGSYHYVFETAKVNDKIRNLQVGISTDSDLILKGAQGQVDYRIQSEAGKLMTNTEAAPQSISNPQFDNFYQQIGQGMIIKFASNLQPLDSYKVTGTYAASSWQLYGKEITITLVIGIILLGAVIFILRRILKGKRVLTTGALTVSNILLATGVGFITAVLLGAHTGLLIFLYSFIVNNYTIYYQISLFISLGLFIAAGSVYLLILVVPAVLVGVKRGTWVGVMTAIATIIWFLLGLMIAIGAALLLNASNPNKPYPVYMNSLPVSQSGIESADAPMKNDLQ